VNGPPVLRLEGLGKSYGSLVAVDAVDLEVTAGARHALIGPNGAGKTTLFDMVGGRTRPTRGRIVFAGLGGERDVTRLSEHARARLGIAKTFQHSNLFDGLSALDNVAIAVQRHAGVSASPWRPARKHADVTERAETLLEQVGLADRRAANAGALSHGERRQLEVAVALATEPRLLLLDEPVAGMSPGESRNFVALVHALPPALSVLIIEHDMDVVFSLATTVSVLAAGKLLASGNPEDVAGSTAVQEAYLGADHAEELFLS
jgi:branched-chain amino acid transport system ATP-binding protein